MVLSDLPLVASELVICAHIPQVCILLSVKSYKGDEYCKVDILDKNTEDQSFTSLELKLKTFLLKKIFFLSLGFHQFREQGNQPELLLKGGVFNAPCFRLVFKKKAVESNSAINL